MIPRDALDEVVRVCEKARQSGYGYMACCPAHEDSSPSFHITPDGDQVLVHCFAGCEFEDIVRALEARGASIASLRPEPRRQKRRLCPRCGAPKTSEWQHKLCAGCLTPGRP